MKKQRGLKRYYRNLEFKIDFDNSTWVDFNDPQTWPPNNHFHFDWNGLGNNSFKKRKPHLDKLFRHFDFLVDKTRSLSFDFQLYAIILDFNSSSDALFLHAPNPNNSQFTFEVEELSSITTLTNKQLDQYITNLPGYEKLYGQTQNGAYCLLYIKNIGKPFYD
jgi:hypothetical protein